MFCSKCGSEIAEGAGFCHICGTKIIHEEMELIQEEAERDSYNDINDFKKFVDNCIQKNTEYQTVEELLKSRVSLRFVWICFAIPAILILMVSLIKGSISIMTTVLLMVFVSLLFGYLSAYIMAFVKKIKLTSKYSAKFEGDIDTEDLITFLNKHLRYLYPYFHEWGHIKREALSVRGAVELTVEDSMRRYMEEINLCTEFGEKQRRLSVISIRPDAENRNSGKMEYYIDVENRIEGASFLSHDMGFAKYQCLSQVAPILQAAMEYYLKIYRMGKKQTPTISQNDVEKQVAEAKVSQPIMDKYNGSEDVIKSDAALKNSIKYKKVFIIVGVIGLISLVGVYIFRNHNMPATEEIEETNNIAEINNIEKTNKVAVEEAEKKVNHWLIDNPIESNYQSNLSLSEEMQGVDNEGNDSWKFDLWVDGEEYAIIFVNKDDGDIIIEYSIWNEKDRTISSEQMPIEQWYSEVYLPEITSDTFGQDTVSQMDYNLAVDEICFNGLPISELIYLSSPEIVQIFGGDYNADGSGRIAYDEIQFYMLDDETVDTIWSFYPEYISINGYTFDVNTEGVINSDEVIELLGQDFQEEWNESGYYITYDYPAYTISFGINKYSEVGDFIICNKSLGFVDDSINESIEMYYGLSGMYNGSVGGSRLSLSIYSSQEVGEVSIGNVEIYVGADYYYFGEIIPTEESVYTVITETGEEIFLVESMLDGTIVLQLYVDGKYIEEYKMEVHYES